MATLAEGHSFRGAQSRLSPRFMALTGRTTIASIDRTVIWS